MFVQSSASLRSSSAIRASTPAICALEELELGRRRASPVAAGRRWRRLRRAPAPARPGRGSSPRARAPGRPSRRRTSAAPVLERDDAVRHGVEQRAVVRDEQDRCRGTPRAPPRAPRAISTSRWFVGSSSTRKFAPDATSSASASRRRSPPESAVTDRSCVSQPEKRKRPSSVCACGRGRPVAAAVASSTDPLVGSSSACCEKYPGTTPCPRSIRPVVERMPAEDRGEQRRLARAVRARRGRPSRRARSRSSRRRAAACRRRRARRPRPRARSGPLRGGSRKSKPSVRRFFVSDSISLRASARSFSSRAICVSFACACFAFDFL